MLPDGDQINECVDLTASNREEWLELSMEVPGGSDSWTAMGLNPWKSRMALWAERCRPTEPDGLSQNEAVRLGTLLEPVVAVSLALGILSPLIPLRSRSVLMMSPESKSSSGARPAHHRNRVPARSRRPPRRASGTSCSTPWA